MNPIFVCALLVVSLIDVHVLNNSSLETIVAYLPMFSCRGVF